MRSRLSIAARASIIVVFLALIRCIGEFFRLEYTLGDSLSIKDVRLYILGAFVCAIAALLMTILSFYSKDKVIIITAVLTVIILLVMKLSRV